MDEIAQKANQARSRRGGDFESKIGELLNVMIDKNKIKSFTRSPIIFSGEFNPDFIIEKNNGNLISIDSTTTVRSDRLRGKQWDAHGTKIYFLNKKNKKVSSFVVVQDTDTNNREKDNFRRCKARCRFPHSAVTDVISVDEFIHILEKR